MDSGGSWAANELLLRLLMPAAREESPSRAIAHRLSRQSATLLELQNNNFGIRPQAQRRPPGSCTA